MKASFDYEPELSLVTGQDLMRLDADWYFTVNGIRYYIPVGYTYDGASIPRIFWTLIGHPFTEGFRAGALAHDWIYFLHILKRGQADEIFRQLMIKSGVNFFQARTMWAGVHGFAMGAWPNTAQDGIALGNLLVEIAKRPDYDKFIIKEAA